MKVKIPSGSSRKAEFLTVEQMTELYEFYTDGIIPETYKHPEQMKQSLGMFLAQYLAMGHSVGNTGQITKRYISPYPIEEQMQYNSYLLDLEELKSLHQKDFSKEELVKMVKESMTKEELLI